MINGSLPAATIHGTWTENIEVWSVDDDTLYDLSGLTEITLKLYSTRAGFPEITLTMTRGQITIPSQGIIQWRAEKGAMETLWTGLYQAIMLLEDGTDTVPLFLGPISIVGAGVER